MAHLLGIFDTGKAETRLGEFMSMSIWLLFFSNEEWQDIYHDDTRVDKPTTLSNVVGSLHWEVCDDHYSISNYTPVQTARKSSLAFYSLAEKYVMSERERLYYRKETQKAPPPPTKPIYVAETPYSAILYKRVFLHEAMVHTLHVQDQRGL